MSELAAGEVAPLFEEICRDPDDDMPRLILADWLEERGDPRGEFIRLQCQQAADESVTSLDSDLRIRGDELLREFEPQWVGSLAAHCSQWTFRRGFVEFAATTAEQFIKHGARWLAEHPLQSVALSVSRGDLGRLAGCPHLARLRGLSLGSHWIETSDLARLLESPHFPALRRLVMLGNHLRQEEAKLLASAAPLKHLELLDLANNSLRNAGLAALAGSPILAQLEVLLLHQNEIRAIGAETLAKTGTLTRLRHIGLRGNPIPAAGVERLRRRFGRRAIDI
jgi:uncharacterized protein (TIGR02996 family)